MKKRLLVTLVLVPMIALAPAHGGFFPGIARAVEVTTLKPVADEDREFRHCPPPPFTCAAPPNLERR